MTQSGIDKGTHLGLKGIFHVIHILTLYSRQFDACDPRQIDDERGTEGKEEGGEGRGGRRRGGGRGGGFNFMTKKFRG